MNLEKGEKSEGVERGRQREREKRKKDNLN